MKWRALTWRWIVRPLGLGVVTTIAVAWGLAAWLPQRGWENLWVSEHVYKFNTPGYWFRVESYRTHGAERRTWHLEEADADLVLPPFLLAIRGPERDLLDAGGEKRYDFAEVLSGMRWGELERVHEEPLKHARDGCEHATGWPLPAGWYAMRDDPDAGIQIRGGVPIVTMTPRLYTVSTVRALPLHPIWAGLAINSAFYGAAWCGVFSAAGTTRRALRRRRGCCAACAYDRRGLDAAAICPECGGA